MQKPRSPAAPLDADQRELLEERIAIMVIDGGLNPAEAERQAKKIIVGAHMGLKAQHAAPASPPEQMQFEGEGYKAMLRDFYKKQ